MVIFEKVTVEMVNPTTNEVKTPTSPVLKVQKELRKKVNMECKLDSPLRQPRLTDYYLS